MESIYHWVGVLVVWAAMVALGTAASYLFYEFVIKPHIGNAWLWVKIFVLRKPWDLTREGARRMTSAYQKTSQLAGWERDMIAYCIKRSRRNGTCIFKPRPLSAAPY